MHTTPTASNEAHSLLCAWQSNVNAREAGLERAIALLLACNAGGDTSPKLLLHWDLPRNLQSSFNVEPGPHRHFGIDEQDHAMSSHGFFWSCISLVDMTDAFPRNCTSEDSSIRETAPSPLNLCRFDGERRSLCASGIPSGPWDSRIQECIAGDDSLPQSTAGKVFSRVGRQCLSEIFLDLSSCHSMCTRCSRGRISSAALLPDLSLAGMPETRAAGDLGG